MQDYRIFFLTINRNVLLLGFIALATVIIMDIWLFNIPEIFNHAHTIGRLIYSICLSIIAAIFFYIITSHIREYQEKRHIYPYVKKKLSGIVSNGKGLFDALASTAGIQVQDKFPNADELENICMAINPKSPAPLILAHGYNTHQANWKEYFIFHVNNSLKLSTHITNHLIYLPPKLIEIVRQFEENSFFSSVLFSQHIEFANTDLNESHHHSFLSYVSLLQSIENYINDDLSYY
jgi:hypothetical protein